MKKQIQEYFEKEDIFFFNSKNFNDYELLTSSKEYDSDYDRISNILLQDMLVKPLFVQSFFNKLRSAIRKQQNEVNDTIYNIDNFINGTGQYGKLALDSKGYHYCLFQKAFNILGTKKKEMYIEYFNETLFDRKIPENKSLKIFNNQYFHEILTSQKLIDISQQREILDAHNTETISFCNNYQQLILNLCSVPFGYSSVQAQASSSSFRLYNVSCIVSLIFIYVFLLVCFVRD